MHRRPQPVGHELVQQPVGAVSAVAFGGINPSRLVTRCTCVSTGIASRPSAKPARPPPSSVRRRAATMRYVASSASERRAGRQIERPSRRRTSRRIAWIRGAFVLASPPERIASATSAVGARHHLAPRREHGARRCANARSAFRSLVCWDSTVRISSSSGSAARGGASSPRSARLEPPVEARMRPAVGGSSRQVDAGRAGAAVARAFRNCVSDGSKVSRIGVGGPVAVLGDDQLGDASSCRVGVVAMDEHDDVARPARWRRTRGGRTAAAACRRGASGLRLSWRERDHRAPAAPWRAA